MQHSSNQDVVTSICCNSYGYTGWGQGVSTGPHPLPTTQWLGFLGFLVLHGRSNWLVVSFCVHEIYCTHTHPFNGSFSGTTQVSQYQKGKTNLDFTEARGSEWQWHQLGHMQVCISLQTDNHASTPPLKFFTGRMPFLPPNQQHESTEGNIATSNIQKYRNWKAVIAISGPTDKTTHILCVQFV